MTGQLQSATCLFEVTLIAQTFLIRSHNNGAGRRDRGVDNSLTIASTDLAAQVGKVLNQLRHSQVCIRFSCCIFIQHCANNATMVPFSCINCCTVPCWSQLKVQAASMAHCAEVQLKTNTYT